MSKEDIKKGYVHYFHEADPAQYPEGYQHIMIDTEARLTKLLGLLEAVSEVAVDLETTSLSPEKAQIVGINLAFEEKRGFYIPIAHKPDAHMNQGQRGVDAVWEVLCRKKTLWYNFLYDGAVLEALGYDIEALDFEDVMEYVHLADTNWKKIPLDWAAKHFLGWELSTFTELIGGLEDFSYLTPKQAIFYACTDSLATLNLYRVLAPFLQKETPFILKLDREVIRSMLFIQKEPHNIDVDHLLTVKAQLDHDLPSIEDQIFQISGRPFDLNSPAQVADILESLGVDTGQRTKKGQLVTRADVLERIDHPIAKLITEYRGKSKWVSTYIEPLLNSCRAEIPIRFKYFIFAAPTGRFAAGKDTKNDYFAPVNIQSVLKPHSEKKFAHYVGGDEGILGWIFNNDSSDRQVEISKPEANIRKAFVAPEGWYFVRIDYCLTEDTLIRVKHGYQTIGSLFRSQGDGVKVWTPEGVGVAEVFETQKKEVVVITLDSGEILECSEDHKLLVRFLGGVKWVSASSLKEGDDVVTQREVEENGWSVVDES